jgi:regulatory protein
MIVTKIERRKRDSRRVDLFIDDEFAFGINEEVLLRSGIRTGDHLTEEALKTIRESQESSLARNRALKLLNGRLRSEAELRADLRDHEFHPDTIESVIGQLRDLRLLDDRRFAHAFVHDARMRRALGRILLQFELKRRGIQEPVIREVLAVPAEAGEEEAVAFNAAGKLLRRYRASRKKLPPELERKRTAEFLGRRGFDWPTITAVMKRLFREEEP